MQEYSLNFNRSNPLYAATLRMQLAAKAVDSKGLPRGSAEHIAAAHEFQAAKDNLLKVSLLANLVSPADHAQGLESGEAPVNVGVDTDELRNLAVEWSNSADVSEDDWNPQRTVQTWNDLIAHITKLVRTGHDDDAKPYAYEYGKSNGDGTYSVVIDRGDSVKVSAVKYESGPPTRAVPDRPIVPLYTRPAPRVTHAVDNATLALAADEMAAVVAFLDEKKIPSSVVEDGVPLEVTVFGRVKLVVENLESSCLKSIEQGAQINDLAVLVRRLVRSLHKHDASSSLCGQASEYLNRKGLIGSPLRNNQADELPEGYAPKFDQVEFDAMVTKGSKAWADVPDNWLELHRGNSPETAGGSDQAEQCRLRLCMRDANHSESCTTYDPVRKDRHEDPTSQSSSISPWINVKDLQPTDEEFVWANWTGADSLNHEPRQGKARFIDCENMGWQPMGCSGWGWRVTHWMHLPPPPKLDDDTP